MCRAKKLYSEKELIISQCQDCKKVGIQLKGLLFNFEQKEFFNYAKKVNSIDFNQHAFQFADDEMKLILKTKDKQVNYCLSHEEFEDLKTGMQIAILMIETEKILSKV
ncbi:DUF6686 family protein [Flammeovirga aprica]|uniref:Uncharacterized protein n=1 Tax=Flammeovirga aprica JL-4 TaxID=694437 RepID=A0A7X9NZI5_9BACT|nr:DUF6686 family protein [Flammeovirga aprica]NME66545.1 hypothetical protein [Flammeovirga aprica JL-4]